MASVHLAAELPDDLAEIVRVVGNDPARFLVRRQPGGGLIRRFGSFAVHGLDLAPVVQGRDRLNARDQVPAFTCDIASQTRRPQSFQYSRLQVGQP